MRIPTVTMYKGNRKIKVNFNDTLRFAAVGWSRKDESTKPTGKPKQVVEQEDINIDDDIVLDAGAE